MAIHPDNISSCKTLEKSRIKFRKKKQDYRMDFLRRLYMLKLK